MILETKMFEIIKAVCEMPINKQTANYKIFLRILSSLEYHHFLIQQGRDAYSW